jgi:ribonuclease HI
VSVQIYTDGSCHTQKCFGAWVAILLCGKEKTVLSGTEEDTTHNRMELRAVIEALKSVTGEYKSNTVVEVISDSQYVIGLRARKEKLVLQNFKTKAGKEIRNADLVKELYSISDGVAFVKIKAHQKKTATINYNIEADVLVRKLMRELAA